MTHKTATTAHELHTAAKALLERSGAATPGPWAAADGSIPFGHRVGSADETEWVAWTGAITEDRSDADAAYIALMNPVVGVAIAAWLEAEAGLSLHNGRSPLFHHALAVARAINGSAA